MNILGIRIDCVTKETALERVSEFFINKKQNKIFTPNPEMIVDASRDSNLKTILNRGDLNICDGFGIKLAHILSLQGAKRHNNFILERIPGVDFMLDICKLTEEQRRSVYFLGSGNQETLKKLKENIQQQFPNLKIVGAHPGNKLQITNYKLQLNEEENNDLISDIVMHSPDILFVAFGHGKQEYWIDQYLSELPSIKVAMGVGGAFDFVSGKVRRAPRLIRKIGLEWLYRLFREPRRLGRIWKATAVFMLYFVKSAIKN